MASSRMSESGTDPAVAVLMARAHELNKRMLATVLPPTTAEELVQDLNSNRLDAPGKARVKRIIQLLQKWQAFLASSGSMGMWKRSRTQSEQQHLFALALAVPGDALDLDELLARYWVSPRIIPYTGAIRIAYIVRKSKGNAGAEEAESGAVMCVLQLALRDELDRVRSCDCGKFFFAHRIDQRYCSTGCRVRYHQSSEEFRAKRREYLRKLYHLKKYGKVKSNIKMRRGYGARKAR